MSLLCGVYVHGSPHKIDINGDKPARTGPFPTTATASCRFGTGSVAAKAFSLVHRVAAGIRTVVRHNGEATGLHVVSVVFVTSQT